jgi:hypothetical protein
MMITQNSEKTLKNLKIPSLIARAQLPSVMQPLIYLLHDDRNVQKIESIDLKILKLMTDQP